MEDIPNITFMVMGMGDGWVEQKNICTFYTLVLKAKVKGNIFFYLIFRISTP